MVCILYDVSEKELMLMYGTVLEVFSLSCSYKCTFGEGM